MREVCLCAAGGSFAYLISYIVWIVSTMDEEGEAQASVWFALPLRIAAYVLFIVSSFIFLGIQGTHEHLRRTSPAYQSTSR